MTSLRIASLLAFALLVSGCPDPQAGKSSPTPGSTATATPSPSQLDPLEGSLFSKSELFALYKAQMADPKDADAKALRVKHRLIDAAGKPVKARQEAFQRALKTYAERDPEGWSEFVQSLADH
jgi:hypothetical protein